MKYSIKHYGSLPEKVQDKIGNSLLTPEAWDLLRTQDESGFYGLKDDRGWFLDVCKRSSNDPILIELEKLLSERTIKKLFSVGVGRAVLEYNIKSKNDKLEIICSDYTPKAINRLANLFPECNETILFDILKGNWKKYNQYTILMNRISTEFNELQWRDIFKSMYEGQIESIIFVPTEDLSVRLAIKERLINLRERLKGHKLIDCGMMYSREMFISFWGSYYKLLSETKIGTTSIYYLERNK